MVNLLMKYTDTNNKSIYFFSSGIIEDFYGECTQGTLTAYEINKEVNVNGTTGTTLPITLYLTTFYNERFTIAYPSKNIIPDGENLSKEFINEYHIKNVIVRKDRKYGNREKRIIGIKHNEFFLVRSNMGYMTANSQYIQKTILLYRASIVGNFTIYRVQLYTVQECGMQGECLPLNTYMVISLRDTSNNYDDVGIRVIPTPCVLKSTLKEDMYYYPNDNYYILFKYQAFAILGNWNNDMNIEGIFTFPFTT